MTKFRSMAAVAGLATMVLALTDLSASAQSGMTNGPNGMEPNTLRSKTTAGTTPSRMMMKRRPMARMRRRTSMDYRPLVVRRTPNAVVAAPVPAPVVAGPGNIVTAPLGVASELVAMPFRVADNIFPPTGDFGTNPLVIVGAPLHAIGDIVQVPFRVIGMPFGGTPALTF